ncbi:ESPR-type extended signal peptide-containing protein [uncultured Haemophilus sp.]|uniref:ESPR-type extended signal peptide-containing protein n=1 Tax=uncultured Haemophilus sp. TaxID=237779 RepID=UPI002585C4CE|nr:ESPR-type extended signal peptide-containing protein [uncultured Haemophilus sp.]
MNKVFKIIWNNVTQSFVVVSELARNRGKLSSEMKKSNVVNLFKLSIFTMCMMGGASQVQAKFAEGGILASKVHDTSIAIADANSTATAKNSITMGNSAKNPYQAGIVLGNWAGAKGSTSGGYNVIIGGNAQVGTTAQPVNQSIAIGAGGGEDDANTINGAWAKGDQSIAIGGNTRSDGNSSIAIGGDDLDRAGSKIYTGADKFIDYDSMHLEQYSTLSPSAQRELNYKLNQAEENGDTKEQALIHCGIYSIEAAIKAYVKKYAKTKKVKDLVESFQEVIESTQVLAKVKTQVATDEEAAQACAERAAAVKAKIEDGKEAKVFKERIAKLNPMGALTREAENLKAAASRKTSRIFEAYGDVITNKAEAIRLVNQFAVMSSDYIAELTSELESAINHEVMETGEKILSEYQDKLAKMDEGTTDKQLDFATLDLIKGALNGMKESAATWCSDDFATETIDDVGEVSYEDKVYYEKVGQEEEEVPDGTEKVKIGTRKVKSGSHREKTGTRTVRNPAKRWWKIFTPKYIEEDVYEEVDDYKEEDVYETRIKYKKVMRDIYEQRNERIEKFSVETSVIQSGLISKFRRNLDEGIEDALSYAENQVESMKKQFMVMFDELDKLVKEKYTELEKCATDKEIKEAELEKNKKVLLWIEECQKEIDEIVNI